MGASDPRRSPSDAVTEMITLTARAEVLADARPDQDAPPEVQQAWQQVVRDEDEAFSDLLKRHVADMQRTERTFLAEARKWVRASRRLRAGPSKPRGARSQRQG